MTGGHVRKADAARVCLRPEYNNIIMTMHGFAPCNIIGHKELDGVNEGGGGENSRSGSLQQHSRPRNLLIQLRSDCYERTFLLSSFPVLPPAPPSPTTHHILPHSPIAVPGKYLRSSTSHTRIFNIRFEVLLCPALISTFFSLRPIEETSSCYAAPFFFLVGGEGNFRCNDLGKKYLQT